MTWRWQDARVSIRTGDLQCHFKDKACNTDFRYLKCQKTSELKKKKKISMYSFFLFLFLFLFSFSFSVRTGPSKSRVYQPSWVWKKGKPRPPRREIYLGVGDWWIDNFLVVVICQLMRASIRPVVFLLLMFDGTLKDAAAQSKVEYYPWPASSTRHSSVRAGHIPVTVKFSRSDYWALMREKSAEVMFLIIWV